jgi:hypothetical protein
VRLWKDRIVGFGKNNIHAMVLALIQFTGRTIGPHDGEVGITWDAHLFVG